jgi:Flp pilus assembly pilin Flp
MIPLRSVALRLLGDETGATMAEFAIVLALFSIAAMGGFAWITWAASNQVQTTGLRMQQAAANP